MQTSVDPSNILKSIMRLMCLFSLFVFTEDMIGLFIATSAAVDIAYDVIHILQVIVVLVFIFRHKLDLKKLVTGGERFSVLSFIAAMLIGYLTAVLGSQLDSLMPGVTVAETSFSLHHILFFMIFAGFVAPVFEEIEFRGLLFRSLKGRIPVVPAMILSSLMFMVLHTGGIQISTFIMAIFSSIVFLWTKNLLYSMAIHFAGNSIPVIMLGLSLFLQDSGADETAVMDAGTSWSSEAVVMILFPLALLVLPFFFLYWKTHRNGSSDDQQIIYKEKDRSVLVYFIIYFTVCIGSTVIQFLYG